MSVQQGGMPDGGPGTSAVHVLGPVDQVPVGEGRAFAVGGEQVAVFRLRDGSLRALSAVCPHRGGPIADGTIDQEVVICPLHQHTFDLVTGCSTSGAGDLRSYVVDVDGDRNLVLMMAPV
ncbi:Rieske (2Fe-2S) protein [Pseudarthrobacter sp. J75]|uniref:Rieske (2Fe-2S) protein n=1 Tax=unclassified Pseudarthrobacter TaxID=2647000 RepID=UPI002E817FD6|nr:MULTISPECIES: Rieske (2Fe-2S) protein [unclassified Pseudarthrobacter]MEE2522178.1 Rieske (2Fe-2S) protein [Pseudarthrobacter sp. J47]MEE2528176.1 Rieske (2Fe-2S) protein [Pseudarthrobacter sp. J75]